MHDFQEEDEELNAYQQLCSDMGVKTSFISRFLGISSNTLAKFARGKRETPEGVIDDMRVLSAMLDDLLVRFQAYLDGKII